MGRGTQDKGKYRKHKRTSIQEKRSVEGEEGVSGVCVCVSIGMGLIPEQSGRKLGCHVRQEEENDRSSLIYLVFIFYA